MTAAPPPARLPSLTGLRWIAALLVFGFHVGTMRIIAEPDVKAVVDRTFALGLSGVEFFFVLSGFVLVWSYRDGEPRRTFLRRRLAKIYPNHLVTFVVALAVAFWFADPVPPWAALGNLFLVQAWIPLDGYFYSVNNVSWSLSCELAFYLCLPFVLPSLRRARAGLLWAAVVAAPLLILALWPGQLLVPEENRWWFAQIFPVVRSLEFWMGAAAAELMRRGRWRGPTLSVASLFFVVTWAVAVLWIRAEFWAALLGVAYLLVIAAAADADVRGRWTPWRSRPMVWLGEVSFAFYLVHVLVMRTVLRLTGDWGEGLPGWWGPLFAGGFLLLNLLLAAALHRWVEMPTMRRLGPSRPTRTTTAAPPVPAPAGPVEHPASPGRASAAPVEPSASPRRASAAPGELPAPPAPPVAYAGRPDPR
ncbi:MULTISPECIES: acyltransferase [Micromonospora]|uniref:Acyltransferase n=1 Tax=Micromonospora solifontis TaxID=2487138 RepID=A0ABX9WG99_9ACTN|nr:MULTISPECIES: acyltransferase [Micromonospora]NES15525.1 acyltransferase [Micromonospora sp. PPF5-17B]NES36905.1 acyltransferase [Micromonospora solifontis]NES55248.1 acyltransferase [Micromonospora sp. PPF5-6]RNL98955.1 acyltransferase [Micromonospora solifontis]